MKTIFTILMLLFVVTVSYSQQIENEMMDVDAPFPKPGLFDNYFKDYTWGKEKWISYSLIAVGSFARGFNFGYNVDGRTFFDKRGHDPYGFFGSESWRLRHVNGDPAQGFKHWIYEHTGTLDFQHFADGFEKYVMVSAGISIGICGNTYNHNWKHWTTDLVLSFLVSAFSERAGYKFVRGRSYF